MKKIVVTIMAFSWLFAQAEVTSSAPAKTPLVAEKYLSKPEDVRFLFEGLFNNSDLSFENNFLFNIPGLLLNHQVEHSNLNQNTLLSTLSTSGLKAEITPLMAAAYYFNHLAIVSLINSGADIKATDSHGNTALSWYYKGGADRVTSDPFVATLLTGNLKTPLMAAAYYNKPLEIAFLVNHGADLEGKTALNWYLKGGTDHGNQYDSFVANLLTDGKKLGITHLMAAAYYCDIQRMVSLIGNGADISAKDSSGKTAHDWYLQGGTAHGNQYDFFIDTLLTVKGFTPLMQAACQVCGSGFFNKMCNLTNIKNLIKEDPKIVAAKDSSGKTALDWYYKAGAFYKWDDNQEVVRLLTPRTLMKAATPKK